MWHSEGTPTMSQIPHLPCTGAALGPVLLVAAGAAAGVCQCLMVGVCRDLTENPLTDLPDGSFLGFTLLQRL